MMTEAERLAAYDRMYADLLKERDKVLADMDPAEAMEMLLARLARTKNNKEFLASLAAR